MRLNSRYLPEYHDFAFIGKCRWPLNSLQLDWVNNVIVLETWLEQYVGPHYTRWAWATDQEHESWQACVAFKYDKHRTLFLLRWTE